MKSSKLISAKMISIIEEQENGFPDKAYSIANESEKVESELK